jgi:maltooligosyltrehalose trehalohydrolase
MMLNEASNVGHALRRRLPIGAEPMGDGWTHFRVWAPAVSSLDVVIEGQVAAALDRDEYGYFAGVAKVGVGALYRFRLDGDRSYPDPASRYQPEGPH